MADCVFHYTEGQHAWKVGYLGFLTRIRGILFTILITFATMGVPWWWRLLLPNSPAPGNLTALSHLAGLVGAVTLSIVFYVRRRSIRSLDIKKNIHLLAHTARDFQAELQTEQRIVKSRRQSLVINHLKEMCNLAADHFSLLTRERDITACIRLVCRDDDTSPTVRYKTYARSIGLNANRDRTTEAIPFDKGIPKLLASQYTLGATIVDSLDEATNCGVYQQTENDQRFADEIKSMIVAPLNGCYAQEYEMIGILYINSRSIGTFKAVHIDAMGFIADMVATVVATPTPLYPAAAKCCS